MASHPFALDVEVGSMGEGAVISQKYRLESLLGEGGMGSIWRAYNLQLEVPVAIKVLRAGLNPAELGERLRVEARAAAKLVHPSIVRVFDIGEAESGEPFIVMELLQGESLGSLLEGGPLSATNALQLMLPIGEALALAHSRGVVHRDLKPDNIFIANEGGRLQPKLLDFGIAKVRSSLLAGGPTLTQAGVLLGSPDYMSPEQAYGLADIDERSDIWAFCVVLYELLAGRTPFAGDSCQEILQAVLTHVPLPLDLLDVDPELATLIHWGLSKDRDARPASMLELCRALAAWLFARGVMEDATGSSLEANWLGRGSDAEASLTPPCRLGTPRPQHDHATLVSVVHPSPRPEHGLSEAPRLPRKRRWLPTAMVAGLALAGGLGWASLQGFGSANAVAGATSPAEPARVSAAAAPAAANVEAVAAPPQRVETIPVSALPVEPPRPKAPVGLTQPAALTKPQTLRTVGNVAPRALPQALPARESQVELINPY